MFIEKVYAQFTVGLPFPGGETEYESFNAYIIDLVGFAILVGSMFAVLVIIYGGFLYATSAGDESKAKSGKDIIVGSLTGFILLILIRLLVPILGIE